MAYAASLKTTTDTRDALRALLGASLASSIVTGGELEAEQSVLPMGLPIAAALPGGGFPRGGVIELVSPLNVGHGLRVALAACSASQQAGIAAGGEMPWCAILDPDRTLFGPAVQASGVELDRLLVLHPPRALLAKVAVRVALSRVFSAVVVDVAGVPGASSAGASFGPPAESMTLWSRAARRLALAVEKTSTSIFLLTRGEAHRAAPLPVAMRVELESEGPHSYSVRVAKEKFGRVTAPRQIVWTRPPRSQAEAR